ncbi:MAG TPA: glycosyltransferase family 2 protein [Flavobacteriales bacterium]|nr:glycosyltransferase family 2 protein [Flavobacteriales bacterium]HQW31108.1 glycosyltransferase family 2 protein [Flavobacteriales bacterium]HQY02176.1 glycosyltransferase family 2 protein [Flavobacteriales bacterium]HRA15898.1 glycosyltransferase family 2 protein [Flavobacteriales bacterium]
MPAAPVKVTVLMTLYNKAPFVAEAVQSILDNTFTDLELLVVDDASTDGGLEVVRSIADPRIRLLESPVNTGRAAAANRGYDAARGEYVAVLDADDIAHPERLAKQVAFMDTHPEVGISGTAYQVLGRSGPVARWPTTDAECRAKLLFGDPVLYGSSIMRRSLLANHALRCDPAWRHPGMDYLFTVRFAQYTRYANLPEALLHYRMGSNNMRHERDPAEDKRRIIKEVFRIFSLPMTDPELELQLALHDLFRVPFTARHVVELRSWTRRLAAMNRERRLFPEDLFEAELERRWKRLFHHLADHDLSAGLTHLRLSGSWPMSRSTYLVKATLNRWTGRKR